ncbi:MAG: HEAT repeat domain-containing protein [Treponema sp.]|nr:HEAT repeat domain-containing protein [Treponema sp.]
MKRCFLCISLIILSVNLYSQELQKKYLKGSLTEKTQVIKEASGTDSVWLSDKSMTFIKENAELLYNDRDFENFTITTIYSLPKEYINTKSERDKKAAAGTFMNLYKIYDNSPNVQIAILTKIEQFREIIPTDEFAVFLNEELSSFNLTNSRKTLFKSLVSALGSIGNNHSFKLLYNLYDTDSYRELNDEISASLVELIPVSMDEAISIVKSKDINKINSFFKIITKNNNIQQKFLSEIAENLLNETILLLSSSPDKKELIVNLQMNSLSVLTSSKWTRASNSMLNFFAAAKNEYKQGILNDDQFSTVIEALIIIAPLEAVNPLIDLLGEYNNDVENNRKVSTNVVIAVINTLGALGDKTAFDILLSVTYLSYPEKVLSAAQTALAGLKW